jgi:hypothetical protein
MITVEHEHSAQCEGQHCYWHNVDEPGQPCYIVCLECGHVYPSARSLRKIYRRELARLLWADLRGRGPKPPPRRDPIWEGAPRDLLPPRFPRLAAAWAMRRLIVVRAGKISFCQFCIHDF